MGESEAQESAQKDLDSLIAKARGRKTVMDGREALALLLERLKQGTGYYFWTALGRDSDAVWQLRQPRPDLIKAEWLKAEPADIMHLCHPAKYLKAVVERDRSGAAHHVGYVRDESNGREELNSFKCARCGRPCPPKIARRAKMQIAFHKLSQDL